MESQPDNIKKIEKGRPIQNSKQLIVSLAWLLRNEEYEKKKPYPKFNIQEARFIRDLIFQKPKGLLFHYLADEIINRDCLKYLPMFNAPSIKKLNFICEFLSSKSAKEAAIKAGFSPHTAKQQAHRILRQIQGHKRMN